MNSNNSASAASDSEFELRARQAILSAKHSIPQVAILLFAFDTARQGLHRGDFHFSGFYNCISTRLRGGLRDSDVVSILSNGHIGILVQSVQGLQDLELVTNRLLTRLEDPVQIDNLTFTTEPRIGASLFPEHGDSVRTLIEHAENNLALTTTGRKPFKIYAAHPHGLVSARQWMSELRKASLATSSAWNHCTRPIYTRRRAHRIDHSVDVMGSSAIAFAVPALERNGFGYSHRGQPNNVES
jgi:hypothetical protein